MPLDVLLVDDDAGVLRSLSCLFETRDFQVATAASATDAIQAVSERPFDLVVTDMRMENHTSGYDVLRAAKARPDAPVVVILSAYPIPATEWRNAGCDAMFMKGGGVFRMLDDLERLVATRKKAPPNPAAKADSKKVG